MAVHGFSDVRSQPMITAAQIKEHAGFSSGPLGRKVELSNFRLGKTLEKSITQNLHLVVNRAIG